MQHFRFICLAIAVAGCSSSGLFALQPPRDGELAELERTGDYERRMESALEKANHRYSPEATRRVRELMEHPDSHSGTRSPVYPQLEAKYPIAGVLSSEGIVPTVTLLIDFADHRAEVEYPGLTASRIAANLYGSGTETAEAYAPRDSLRRYYERASKGKLVLTGKVLGWYHFDGNQTDYADLDADDNRLLIFDLVAEALQAYDETTDFSQFDNDGDGFIDAVNVLWVPRGRGSGVTVTPQGSLDAGTWFSFIDGEGGVHLEFPEVIIGYRRFEVWFLPANAFTYFRLRLSLR